jgi:hypothetical protein
MTEQERDERIVEILTKICINVLVKNLFDKNGDTVIQEILTELNRVPEAEAKDNTRCNSSQSFLHKTAMEYLQKTLAFKEKNNLK